jgi:hypothetical protein
MSRKRRKDRNENINEIVTLDLSSGKNADNTSQFEDDSKTESSKSGVITYLKTHLWIVGVIAFLTLGTLGAGLKYLDESAQREVTRRGANKGTLNNQHEQSFLNKVNPFLPTPTPTPTPLPLSKSYIYAGSRLLAVEDANANAAPPADLAVWRESTGTWWVMGGTGTQQVSQSWGQSGDKEKPGDYDGDGKTDFAVFRPSNSNWYLINSSTGASDQFAFGTTDDKAVPADYDGDGKTDIAVFRNSNTTWYILQSSTGATVSGSFGSPDDEPKPADFDGDGKADLAVYRNSTASFYSLNSSNLQTQTTSFGSSGDQPVPADYDGDGRADIAVWRSSNATWYVKQSSSGSTITTQFGISSDTPVYNDYDGDGKCDIAVWRGESTTPSEIGKWYILNSSNPGTPRQETWGIAGDIPVPAFWKRQ